MKKRIVILGSTGSVGANAVKVALALPDLFETVGIAANTRTDLIAQQAAALHCRIAITADPERYEALKNALPASCTAAAGTQAMIDLVSQPEVDLVVCAIVGSRALPVVMAAIEAGKTLALATKEVLVMAGTIVMRRAAEKGVKILPVDSEHNAIFQSLNARPGAAIHQLLLTASGGPFRKTPASEFDRITPEVAMKHPTWNMGPKVTLDSSTLMNKALEMIEAHHLFSVPESQIRVLVHPQSIIHSMVEFADRSIIAQLSPTDMRFPIQYAMTWPDAVPGGLPALDFAALTGLTFEEPDTVRFPALNLAREAIRRGGAAGAILNAANEIAGQRFFKREITFPMITSITADAMERFADLPGSTLEELLEADEIVRRSL